MKLILAIVKPFKLEEVRAALDKLAVRGMTVSEANGYGRQKGHTEIYRGSEYTAAFMPKVRLELAVPDQDVDRTIEAIRAAARTGQIGDGKIFVLPMERACACAPAKLATRPCEGEAPQLFSRTPPPDPALRNRIAGAARPILSPAIRAP